MPGADGCWVRWRKAYSGPFSRLVDENFEGDTQRLTRGTYKLITLQHRIRREIEFKKRKKRERIYFWVRNETKQVSKAARQGYSSLGRIKSVSLYAFTTPILYR